MLPLASAGSQDSLLADSMDTDTCVPCLAVAEQHGADEAMEMIRDNYMQRGFELENMALEARSEYQDALASHGGQ